MHELVISILCTAIEEPKLLLNHYECMASLGSVSRKLQKLCKWDENMFQDLLDARVAKNPKITNMVQFKEFFEKKINKENGPFTRCILADLFGVTIDAKFWQHHWRNKHLNEYIAMFNKRVYQHPRSRR